MSNEQAAKFTLVLTEDERAELLRLIERSSLDVHAEKRRTEAPAYRERVGDQETVIHTLLEKIRQLRP